MDNGQSERWLTHTASITDSLAEAKNTKKLNLIKTYDIMIVVDILVCLLSQRNKTYSSINQLVYLPQTISNHIYTDKVIKQVNINNYLYILDIL